MRNKLHIFCSCVKLMQSIVQTSTSVVTDMPPAWWTNLPARGPCSWPAREPERVARALANSSDLRACGKQSSPKCVIPCLRRLWNAEKMPNLMPLAILGGEIRYRTNEKNSNRRSSLHLAYRHEWIISESSKHRPTGTGGTLFQHWCMFPLARRIIIGSKNLYCNL